MEDWKHEWAERPIQTERNVVLSYSVYKRLLHYALVTREKNRDITDAFTLVIPTRYVDMLIASTITTHNAVSYRIVDDFSYVRWWPKK